MKKIILFGISCALLFSSCVSKKILQAEQFRYVQLQTEHLALQEALKSCDNTNTENLRKRVLLEAEIESLKKQIGFLKENNGFLKDNNNQALKQLENLSVISGSQAESIKKSLENIGSKDAYIQGLQSALNRKDSLNLALVTNLKGAIGNMDDKDINIKVEKGVVYIDISDKLLFKSGSFNITDKAKVVLGKVAKVLAAQPAIEFMVEGHTDSKQLISGGNLMEDNWDLSVKRATTIVRILQDTYGIEPKRMTAAGRSEYIPVVENDTPEHRAANRRTRIVILPQLDQFFQLLEKK
jgi:chemotaxis protein MotB